MTDIIVDISKNITLSYPLEEKINLLKPFKFNEICFIITDYIPSINDNIFIDYINKFKYTNIITFNSNNESLELITNINELKCYQISKNIKLFFIIGAINNINLINTNLGIHNLIKNNIPICILNDYLLNQNNKNYINIDDIKYNICCNTYLSSIIFLKKNKKIYVVDIDETICSKTYNLQYEKAIPWENKIQKINKLYNDGHTIIYWTARGALSGIDFFDLTKNQLKKWNAKYHLLKVKKPYYDRFIDDKCINITFDLKL